MRFQHGYVHGYFHAGVGVWFAKLNRRTQPKAESPMADLVAAQNLLRSVFGCSPKISAAPFRPEIRHPVTSRVSRM